METMNKAVEMMAVAAAACGTAIAAPQMATLQEATVFLNGAELRHEAVLTVEKGENEIVLEGLSPVIDLQSLKINMTGGVIISSYEFSTDFLSKDKQNKNAEQLQADLDKALKELKQLQNRETTLQQMKVFLVDGLTHSVSVERQAVTTETIEKNLTYYEQKIQKIESEKADNAEKQAELNNRIAALKQQIRQEATQGSKRAGVVKLIVNAPKAGKVKTDVKYFTERASWTPFYDINVSELGAPINFVMKAHVRQTTGIDWEQVRLTLSTGMPARSNTMPEFSTWFLKKYEPAVYAERNGRAKYDSRVMMEPMLMRSAVVEESVSVEDIMEEESDATVEQYVQTTEQTLSVEYAIDLPYTILGNGKEQTIGLREIEAKDVEYKYYALPKLDATVYLTAEIKNWNGLGLLNGMANLTFDGTFIGQSYIDTENIDGAIRLTLGDDRQIVVKREKQQDYSKKSGIFGNNKNEAFVYKLTVRNNKKQPVKIVVKDQYPITTNEQIKIELLKQISTPNEIDKERGIITFERDLQSGQSAEMIVAYQVEYPKDWSLINLR